MHASFDSAVTQVRNAPHGEIDEIRRLYAAGEIASAMARAESVWCPEKLSHGTVLKVTVTPATLLQLPLDPKGAFVFSRVDGVSDVEAILHVAGMPEAEAIALLEKLVIVGAISIAEPGPIDDDTMQMTTDARPDDDTLTLRR